MIWHLLLVIEQCIYKVPGPPKISKRKKEIPDNPNSGKSKVGIIITIRRIAMTTTNRVAIVTMSRIAISSMNRIAIITSSRIAIVTMNRIAILYIYIYIYIYTYGFIYIYI